MIIEEIEGVAAFAELEANWNAVYRADPDARIFLSWRWLHDWLNLHNGPYVILAAKAIESPTAPYIAFFPLRIRTTVTEGGMLRNEINMAGNFSADYTGLICDPKWDERAIPAFARHLKRMNWQRVNLENTRLSDGRMRLLLACFPKATFNTEHVNRVGRIDGIDNNICPFTALPENWDAYLERLSANTRQKIRRLLKVVDRGDDLRITHADDETYERDIDTLLKFWEIKWKQRKGDRVHQLVRSNRAMLCLAFRAGHLFVPTLWQADRPLAALAIFNDRDKASWLFYITGRDETFDGPSSGHILHGYSIRQAIAQGVKEYDFLRGNERYKYSFGVTERRVHCIVIATKNGVNLDARLDPRSLSGALEQATALHRAGKNGEAERAYRQILEIDPKNVDALHRLGQLLAKSADHVGAIRLFKKLTGLRPDLYKPWLCLADCYEQVDRGIDAIDCYREAIRITPDSPEIFARLATTLSRLGRLCDVNEALERVFSQARPTSTNDRTARPARDRDDSRKHYN